MSTYSLLSPPNSPRSTMQNDFRVSSNVTEIPNGTPFTEQCSKVNLEFVNKNTIKSYHLTEEKTETGSKYVSEYMEMKSFVTKSIQLYKSNSADPMNSDVSNMSDNCNKEFSDDLRHEEASISSNSNLRTQNNKLIDTDQRVRQRFYSLAAPYEKNVWKVSILIVCI